MPGAIRDESWENMRDRIVEVVTAGVQVFDLGRPLFFGMPKAGAHPDFRLLVDRRHGDVVRQDESSGSSELFITGGHVGTHIDALSHISHRGKLYGGIDVADAFENGRYSKLGIDTVEPIVARGVLLDVPRALGLSSCPPGYEITPADLEAARAAAAISPEPGDVILVRTGWGQLFDDREAYEGRRDGTPGPGEAGCQWLAGFRPRAVGADTLAFERLAGGIELGLPGHRLLIVELGIHIIEVLDLEAIAAAGVGEFVFVVSPLKLTGGTGSPVRPIAIVDAARSRREIGAGQQA
jgi:kynurenine formamidase